MKIAGEYVPAIPAQQGQTVTLQFDTEKVIKHGEAAEIALYYA